MASNAFLMADRLAGGELVDTIRAKREQGQSFDAIASFLYGQWGIYVSGPGVQAWLETAETGANP